VRPGTSKARIPATLLIVATLAFMLLPVDAMHHRMMLRLEIWRADVHLLNVYAAVDEGVAVARMWDAMGTSPILGELRDPGLQARAEGERQLDLEGLLRLRLCHRDRLLSEAELQGLQLRRCKPDGRGWRLAGDAAGRAEAAAGI